MKQEVKEDKSWNGTVNEIVSIATNKIVDWGQQHGPNAHTGMCWTLEAVIDELQSRVDGFYNSAEAAGEKVAPYKNE